MLGSIQNDPRNQRNQDSEVHTTSAGIENNSPLVGSFDQSIEPQKINLVTSNLSTTDTTIAVSRSLLTDIVNSDNSHYPLAANMRQDAIRTGLWATAFAVSVATGFGMVGFYTCMPMAAIYASKLFVAVSEEGGRSNSKSPF